MTRAPTGFVAVLVIVASALGVQAAFDAEKQSAPPHAARPDLAGAPGPLPLAAVGGDHPQAAIDLAVAIYATAAEEQTEHERSAAEEAARMAAARTTPRVDVVAPRGAAPPAPTGDGGCAYAEQIRAAWAGTGDEDFMIAVAIRESHCTPGARNPSGASGIFQLMMPLHRALVADVCGEPADDLVFTAECNIAAARALYAGSGRDPWS